MRDCFPSIVMCWLRTILAQSHLLSAMCKVKSGCLGRWKCWPVRKATSDHDILQCDSYLAISIYFGRGGADVAISLFLPAPAPLAAELCHP